MATYSPLSGISTSLWRFSVTPEPEFAVFDWDGLPDELKVRILTNCLHKGNAASCHRDMTAFEIYHQLGASTALMAVSRNMRALVLELCLNGSSEYQGGLCILATSFSEFERTLKRLGTFHQMVEPYSQLQDEETVDLRRMYMKEPKLYPELRRFATFKHGIRKLCLNLDFDSFLHFLKITIAYVHHDTGKPRTTCDVLEELPNLDGIRLILPGPNNAHGPRNLGPIVWHDTHPCPRKLHRMIYVRAAEVFVTFKDFVVENFFDELEEKSFNELRKITDLQARFTKLELNELYEDCKGGIKLDVPAPEVHSPRVSYLESYMTGQAGRAQDDKFPPVCDCDVSCHETFQWVGKYKESAGEASTG